MNAIKPWHIFVLVIVIILLFGAKRLPELAKSVGQSLKIFKNEVKDLADDDPKVTPAQRSATSPAEPTAQPGSTTVPPSGGDSSTPA